MGNKLGGSADSRSPTSEFPSDSTSSRLDEAEVQTRAPAATVAPITSGAGNNGLRGQDSSRYGRGRGGSAPPISTRSGRWLRVRAFGGGGTSAERAPRPVTSFRRSNSADHSTGVGDHDPRGGIGGIGLARAGSFIRTRFASRRNIGVGESGPRRERRGSRVRGLIGTRARDGAVVEGVGNFAQSVRGGSRFRTTAGVTVLGSALSAAAAAEVAARGRSVPGGLRLPPEGMQQTRCPVCRATLLIPSSVANFRCPCGVHFSRADRMPAPATRITARITRSVSASTMTPTSTMTPIEGAATRMTATSTATAPSVSMRSTASAPAGGSTATVLNAPTPRTTASSMSSASSSTSSSSSSSSSSQSLSLSPPMSPPSRSLLGINFANSGSGIARRRPFSRTRSGASTTPSSPLLTPTTSRTSTTATTPLATLTAATAAAEAAAASASAAGAAAGRAAAAAATAGLPVNSGGSGTPSVGTPTISRHGSSRSLWSGRGAGSRTLNMHGSLFARSSGSGASGGNGAGLWSNVTGTSASGIALSAGVITGGTVTSPVTATGLERRRRRAGGGSSGSNHIQVVICSICGRGGVIQTPESLANRSMIVCTCGNRVIPATPAQLLAALSRGTGASQRGASPQLINLLPTIEFREESLRQMMAEGGDGRGELSEDDDKVSCRVCLSDYEQGDTLRILPCLHKFHQTCIDKWLGRRTLCPLCNTSVDIVYNDPLYVEGSSRTPTS